MARLAAIGALVLGITAAVAGYVWTAFEFPFTIIVPAFVGWYIVARVAGYANRTALLAGLVGGVAFTVVFLFGISLALNDDSPVPFTAWLAAAAAAAVAGALAGTILGRMRGAAVLAVFSGVGMLIASLLLGLMRENPPAGTEVPGPAQYLYFAAAIGIVGLILGGFIGAGVSWLRAHEPKASPAAPPAASGQV